MLRNLTNRLLLIALVLMLAIWVDANENIQIPNPFKDDGSPLVQIDVKPRLGLDLQGGLQVLLEADLAEDVGFAR